jgi:hypothetical protein
VFLRGFRGDLGRDGEGLAGAAGGRVFRGLEDLGPVPVQGHRGGPERAADLAHDRGAHDPGPSSVPGIFLPPKITVKSAPCGRVAARWAQTPTLEQ